MPSNIRRQEEPYPSALCDAPQGCEKPADYRHDGKCHGRGQGDSPQKRHERPHWFENIKAIL